MSKTLSHADIRNLLEGFAAAIGFDQRRVDTMPLWKFDPRYDEDMWRQWRAGHIRQIGRILQSVDEIPSSMARFRIASALLLEVKGSGFPFMTHRS